MFMKMIMMLVNGDVHDGGDAEGTFSVVFDEGFTCHQEVWTAPEKASHAKEQVKSWKRGEIC